MTTPNHPSAIALRGELEALWSELEPWVAAGDAWATGKEAAGTQVAPALPNTPDGQLTPEKMDDVEDWANMFRAELDSVKHVIDTIPARSVDELRHAISDAQRLSEIPRGGFRGK